MSELCPRHGRRHPEGAAKAYRDMTDNGVWRCLGCDGLIDDEGECPTAECCQWAASDNDTRQRVGAGAESADSGRTGAQQ